jgi:leucyl aminopeptidase (aminopeptidase T)
MAEEKKKLRLSDVYKSQAKVMAARKRIKARAKAAKAAAAGEAEGSDKPEVTKSPKSAKAKAVKAKATKATPARRRIRADELPWKTVNTSTLPGMDGGGGMMMLEELDGVGVEWTEDAEGRKTARFTVSLSCWLLLMAGARGGGRR